MTNKIDILKEDLINLYNRERLSSYEIAEIFKCDPTIIQKRLKEYQIKIRYPKDRINISKELLKELYIKKGFSTYKIAKQLKIGRTTIYNNLINFGIKTRPKKIVYISRDELVRLYRIKKLSLSQIARKYDCTPSAILKKLEYNGIKRRNKFEANIKYPKKKFNGGILLKAYMIGFRIGDLNVRRDNEKSTVIRISTNTTKKEQLNLIKDVFGRYGHFYYKWIGNSYNINCSLDKSFNFLLEKPKNIDSWILDNDKYFISFLAGYTDAEGNMGIYENRARYRVGSYDKEILVSIHKKLTDIGINTKIRLETPKGIYGGKTYNKDFWRVSVNAKEDLLRLLKLLKPNIKHKKRYKDLIKAEKNIIER